MRPLDRDTLHEWLDLEVDGALPPAERRALREELAASVEWRRERETLERLRALLASSRVEPHPGFRERVMGTLPPTGWEARQPRAWGLALALLAVLLGGAVALVAGSGAAPSLAGLAASVLDLFWTSALAGAGLLAASWRGLGMGIASLFEGSPTAVAALAVAVVGLNLLLFRLLRRRPRPAATPRRHRD